jgi:hypothetical protein
MLLDSMLKSQCNSTEHVCAAVVARRSTQLTAQAVAYCIDTQFRQCVVRRHAELVQYYTMCNTAAAAQRLFISTGTSSNIIQHSQCCT